MDQPVSNMDVTATMLEAAGVSVPAAMDSRSLLPLCDGNMDAGRPDELICEHNGHGGEDILQRMIIYDRFKYVAALYDGDELYDLTEDPCELHNLIDVPEYREVRADLRQRIVAHIERTNDVGSVECNKFFNLLRMNYFTLVDVDFEDLVADDIDAPLTTFGFVVLLIQIICLVAFNDDFHDFASL